MATSSKAYIFECDNATYAECIREEIFGSASPWPLEVKKGDYCCLCNTDVEKLFGLWRAISDGARDIDPNALERRFPYQVRVERVGGEVGEMGGKVRGTYINPTTGKLENVLQVGKSECTLGL